MWFSFPLLCYTIFKFKSEKSECIQYIVCVTVCGGTYVGLTVCEGVIFSDPHTSPLELQHGFPTATPCHFLASCRAWKRSFAQRTGHCTVRHICIGQQGEQCLCIELQKCLSTFLHTVSSIPWIDDFKKSRILPLAKHFPHYITHGMRLGEGLVQFGQCSSL